MADDWHLVHLGSRAVGRGGAGDGRGHGGRPRGPDHARRHGDLGRPARRAAGPDRPVRPLAGGGAGHPARPRRPQGELRRRPGRAGPSLKTPEEGGWTVVGPSPIPFNEGDPRARAARRGRDRRRRRRLRGRGPPGAGGRVPGHRDPLGPRLPAARVPLAAEQPPDRTSTAAAWRTGCGSCCGSPSVCAHRCPGSCRCSCGSRRPTGPRGAGTSSSRSSWPGSSGSWAST